MRRLTIGEQVEIKIKIALAFIEGNEKALDRIKRGCFVCGLFPEETGLSKPRGLEEWFFPTSCPKCRKWS